MMPHTVDTGELIQFAMAVIDIEADAIRALATRLDARFVHACELLLACETYSAPSGPSLDRPRPALGSLTKADKRGFRHSVAPTIRHNTLRMSRRD